MLKCKVSVFLKLSKPHMFETGLSAGLNSASKEAGFNSIPEEEVKTE